MKRATTVRFDAKLEIPSQTPILCEYHDLNFDDVDETSKNF